MKVSRADLSAEIRRNCRISTIVADNLRLPNDGMVKASAHLSRTLTENYSKALPVLERFEGFQAFATVLSVDLRKSSQRAVEVGARGTYITIHTYLPTMAWIVEKCRGTVSGLRGDGLCAVFGMFNIQNGDTPTAEHRTESVADARDCATTMVEAVEEMIGPHLLEFNIGSKSRDKRMQVGVGIDLGKVVITTIGSEKSQETTAYGPPVNNACKLHDGNSEIRLTSGARDSFPTSKNGKANLVPRSSTSGMRYYLLSIPEYSTIE